MGWPKGKPKPPATTEKQRGTLARRIREAKPARERFRRGEILWRDLRVEHFHGRRRMVVPIKCAHCKKIRLCSYDNVSKRIRMKTFSGACASCAPASGSASGHWKGGRSRNKNGYIGIWIPANHRFAGMRHGRGYVPEHRLLMAQKLGRGLESWEHVHHRNGKKDDNRIENLELLPHHEHGQVESMVRRIQLLESALREKGIAIPN